ncbi:hypothetical protein EIN_172710 [Entamoeba invadens IP1]|uniref:Uncharacterized protein n=1 Tax=Entamoeba invadens IP1 TaxID=370355 RepID=A0A0A1TVZ6_ENTIV|nr:hypothetical protein EIN_172710 [Entamoeba invadens IP1]ELP84626.1 hypothetical protein EIN_172710 [Entamoeba invadens IP1]|eukprot:XP_004183972.1 hypothetical protein EIN_172710 [Entamoeba invadens IP1]
MTDVLKVLRVLEKSPSTVSEIITATELDKEKVITILSHLGTEGITSKKKISDEEFYYSRVVPAQSEIDKMKAEIIELNKSFFESSAKISDFEKTSKNSLEKVHLYNDTKDVGQMLLGKLGQLEGKTIHELYDDYGLDQED